MNVYTSVDHEGFYVGVASLVVAASEADARELLCAALRKHGLNPDRSPFTLQRVDTEVPCAIVLCDGDY